MNLSSKKLWVVVGVIILVLIVGITIKKLTSTGQCEIKGNINDSGEKIYHLPGCDSYVQTQIDESRGERWFCSEAEAQSAGWRKALNCN